MQYIPLKIERPVPSDGDISAAVIPKDIEQIAKESGILKSELIAYGPTKAKVKLSVLDRLKDHSNGKMVVVTGVSPTKFGEGKTTTLLGLVQALNVELGHLAFGTIRQPSQGPTFGIKGGAAGGGYSQVIPMADVNLHLTGDIHAVSAAHNLLAAAIDARVLHEETTVKTSTLFKRLVPQDFTTVQRERLKRLGIDSTKHPSALNEEEMEKFSRLNIDRNTISIRRVVDCNDRMLREITIGQGENEKGMQRSTGYDISVASEVMAILALCSSAQDFRKRVGEIVVAKSKTGQPILAEDIGVAGAMAALMNDALLPNLIQSLEGTPVFMHAGPFANIAHGQSSVLADQMALKLAGPSGYCVTESGFGADMGFEKFAAIKARASKVTADCAVLVVSARAIKMHGEAVKKDNETALEAGCHTNMAQHIHNIVDQHNVPVVVAINAFGLPSAEQDKENDIISAIAKQHGAHACAVTYGWCDGSKGAKQLAEAVVDACQNASAKQMKQLYKLTDSYPSKILSVVTNIYKGANVSYSDKAKSDLEWIEKYAPNLPICMAKTPLSFSHDPELKGAPKGFTLPITAVRLSKGAGFVYPMCGDIQTMPGLPTRPAFWDIDVDSHGTIKGLF